MPTSEGQVRRGDNLGMCVLLPETSRRARAKGTTLVGVGSAQHTALMCAPLSPIWALLCSDLFRSLLCERIIPARLRYAQTLLFGWCSAVLCSAPLPATSAVLCSLLLRCGPAPP